MASQQVVYIIGIVMCHLIINPRRLLTIYQIQLWMPQLFPYLMVATRGGLALIWKIVLVVELLGRSNGVGFQLHMAFQVFDVSAILAYSLAFIAVVQLIELAILQPLENRSSRWRQPESVHA